MIEVFSMQNEKIERHSHPEQEQAVAQVEALSKLTKGTIWVRCVNPVSDDIETLSRLTGISVEELKESIEENERSKVNVQKHLEIVFKAPAIQESEIITLPIYIYVTGNILATIERTSNKVLNDLSIALVDNKRRFLFKKSGGYFIYYILDKVNDEFLYFIDKISIKIELFRDKQMNKEAIQKIYDTSITLSYFNQALIANIEVLNELRKSYYKFFEHDDRRRFSELYYDALQVLDTERIQREVLTNLFNMHSTIKSNELNYFMKIVALVALLTTFPLLIMNLFAMNVKTPYTQETYSFYIILGSIVISAFISYYFFKKFEK